MADTRVTTGKVRFSYVHVFEPTAMEVGQDPKYNISILIPKTDTVTIDKVKAAIQLAAENNKSIWKGKVPKNLNSPLRDGDIEKEDDEAYAGHYFLNAKSKSQPGIVDASLQAIISQDEFYSGCYGRASVNFYAYEKGKTGVACGLNNLQKLEDGERLGGDFSKAEDDFGGDNTWDDMMA